MSRPLRLQIPGGIYHVMSRGNAREQVFADDVDRQRFLVALCRVSARLEWQVLGYCLMSNHYHLVVETRQATLARGMRDVNGGYGQAFNRRHGRVGHVFQGRYKALIVESGAYLLEVLRYVARNPVKAGLCADPIEWPWSSHRAILGVSAAPRCFDAHAVLSQFSSDVAVARASYARFVASDEVTAHERSSNPVVVGSHAFTTDVVGGPHVRRSPENPRRQRAVRSLSQCQEATSDRDLAIRLAHASGSYSLAEIGRHFGLHYSTVSRICREVLENDVGPSVDAALGDVRQFKT